MGERYLLHVYAMACAAEDEACSHGFCEPAGLSGELVFAVGKEMDDAEVYSPDWRSLLGLLGGN